MQIWRPKINSIIGQRQAEGETGRGRADCRRVAWSLVRISVPSLGSFRLAFYDWQLSNV